MPFRTLIAKRSPAFSTIAHTLLHGAELVIAQRPFAIVELEFYWHAPDHPDPFSHQHPDQQTCGRWCLHRAGKNGFRSGSYKGLDLSFGPAEVFGGVLLRTLEDPAGQRIEGPSLIVDHILSATALRTVRDLHERLAPFDAFDVASPLHLRVRAPGSGPVYRTARVGLTLKRRLPLAEQYLFAPLRFLSSARVRKGRNLLACALLLAGHGVEDVSSATGVTSATLRRWKSGLERGAAHGELRRWSGRALPAREVPEALGASTVVRNA